MSTLYLVDLFANPLATTKIIDVHSGPDVLANGVGVIRVPDYISVVNPVSANDLIIKKHLGILAFYAGFANIVLDDLFFLGDVNLVAPNVKGIFGERNVVRIFPGSKFQSTVVGLAGPPAPEAIITWETFESVTTDGATSRVLNTYREVPSTDPNFLCEVSFNNGVNFYPTLDGALLNIPLIGQGTQFIIRLTNNTPAPPGPFRILNVGSWAVVYLGREPNLLIRSEGQADGQ